MNLLVFNLVTDVDDPILGFTSRWVDALARRVAHVDVITMRAGAVRTPANVTVHSVGKERGFGEMRRAIEFYRMLRGVLSSRRIDACFSHMMPLFSVMGAPLLRARRVPIVTWYTHRQLSTIVRMAYAVSSRVVTASADSWPYLRDKLTVVGHGIDTEVFCPVADRTSERALVVSVGRIAPIKNTHVMIEAARILRDRDRAVEWALVGAELERDRAYADGLRRTISASRLDGVVRMPGPAAHDRMVGWHREAALHLSLSPQGLFDKAVLEAMACGTPSLVAHHGYDELLGDAGPLLRVPAVSAEAVADAVLRMLASSAEARRSVGRTLREAVVARHSLSALADRLVGMLDELATGERGRLAA